jgi:uncharacterized Fe-S cluster protein YjdI
MDQKIYEYKDLKIIWKPKLCIHSAKCVKGLPQVFKPKDKPWIQPEGAELKELINTIKTCPSGALSYKKENKMEDHKEEVKTTCQIINNGPVVVMGPIEVIRADGTSEIKPRASFCRCGLSSNKPFCDGTHKASPFE